MFYFWLVMEIISAVGTLYCLVSAVAEIKKKIEKPNYYWSFFTGMLLTLTIFFAFKMSGYITH